MNESVINSQIEWLHKGLLELKNILWKEINMYNHQETLIWFKWLSVRFKYSNHFHHIFVNTKIRRIDVMDLENENINLTIEGKFIDSNPSIEFAKIAKRITDLYN